MSALNVIMWSSRCQTEVVFFWSLLPRLSELLGTEVKMANDSIGDEVEKLALDYLVEAVGQIPRNHLLLLLVLQGFNNGWCN
ncbi:Phosphoglycerate kinase cytosolic [Bienertia sinuspersici]